MECKKVKEGAKRRRTGSHIVCAASGCYNNYQILPKLSFHRFPDKKKDLNRYNAWVRAVKKTRDDWNGPPCKYSSPAAFGGCVLCSEHFDKDCFVPVNKLKEELGYRYAPTLKPDAVPTKFFERTHKKEPKMAVSRTTNGKVTAGMRVDVSKRSSNSTSSRRNSAPISLNKRARTRSSKSRPITKTGVKNQMSDFVCQTGESFVNFPNNFSYDDGGQPNMKCENHDPDCKNGIKWADSECCAYGCSKRIKSLAADDSARSSSDGSDDEESAVKRRYHRTFHRIPDNEILQRRWIQCIRRKDWAPTKFSVICSDHFPERSICRSGNKTRLLDNALPTRFKKFPKNLVNEIPCS